jgi:hypothetical protein
MQTQTNNQSTFSGMFYLADDFKPAFHLYNPCQAKDDEARKLSMAGAERDIALAYAYSYMDSTLKSSKDVDITIQEMMVIRADSNTVSSLILPLNMPPQTVSALNMLSTNFCNIHRAETFSAAYSRLLEHNLVL